MVFDTAEPELFVVLVLDPDELDPDAELVSELLVVPELLLPELLVLEAEEDTVAANWPVTSTS